MSAPAPPAHTDSVSTGILNRRNSTMKLHSSHNHRDRRSGFSLPELMVVIVIIGLLATLVVPNVMRNLGQAFKGKVKSDITAIANAVDNYAIENAGVYPESLEDLLEPPDGGPSYLKGNKIPLDPWKVEYQYEPPYGDTSYRVYTLGKDGQQGGEGDNADISNIDEEN